MTAAKHVQYQVHLSIAVTEATTCSISDADLIASQLEREIYGITSNEQMRSKKAFSIRQSEFEGWCQTIHFQVLWKTIEQHVMHFGYPRNHFLSHISESI